MSNKLSYVKNYLEKVVSQIIHLWYDTGLVIFVIALSVDGIILLIDLYLVLTGQESITHLMFGHPVAVAIVLLWQVLGLLGLAMHFFNDYPLPSSRKKMSREK